MHAKYIPDPAKDKRPHRTAARKGTASDRQAKKDSLGGAKALKVQRVRIDTLKLDDRNARLHDDENLAAIRSSLQSFGQVEPLVVHASTRRVIGGNGRLSAMLSLGMTECDIVEINIDESRARALAIALNRTGELAAWNVEELNAQLAELADDFASLDLGFNNAQLDALMKGDVEAAHGFTPPRPKKDAPQKPEAALTPKWLLIVQCTSETQQAELIEEFEKRGIDCTAPSA